MAIPQNTGYDLHNVLHGRHRLNLLQDDTRAVQTRVIVCTAFFRAKTFCVFQMANSSRCNLHNLARRSRIPRLPMPSEPPKFHRQCDVVGLLCPASLRFLFPLSKSGNLVQSQLLLCRLNRASKTCPQLRKTIEVCDGH